MIPKIIHYCWFGNNPKPDLMKKCIKSWRKHCPDYEIIEWNERNFDIFSHRYMKEAYEAKKWAFVSDLARLKIIYEYGGIYLDTDVELIKPLDSLLEQDGFMGMEVAERGLLINSGVGFGATRAHSMVKSMIEQYDGAVFILPDGSYDLVPCPVRNTAPFISKGFVAEDKIQEIGRMSIYPAEYFSPKNHITRELKLTHCTYSIHHYGLSWGSKTKKTQMLIYEISNRIIGVKATVRLKTLLKKLTGR